MRKPRPAGYESFIAEMRAYQLKLRAALDACRGARMVRIDLREDYFVAIHATCSGESEPWRATWFAIRDGVSEPHSHVVYREFEKAFQEVYCPDVPIRVFK